MSAARDLPTAYAGSTDLKLEPLLRRAQIEDANFLLTVRNRPEMIALSSSQQRIDPAEHQRWLRAVLQSQQHLLLIIGGDSKAEAQGYARLDCLSADTAAITVVLLPEWQGKGLGGQVIERISQYGFATWPCLRHILAHIRLENLKSQNAFLRVGFRKADTRFQEAGHVVLMLTPT